MEKQIKIWGVRSGMIGDMIMALPILNWLGQIYPHSYKYWAIGQRFSQALPLFINHPMIDKIHILKTAERLSDPDDIKIAQNCDVHFNITPEHPDGTPGINCFWWNEYNLCEETFRMAGLNIEEYKKMPKELQKPKLEKWFESNINKKTIGIWPFAAYGKEPQRSPSLEWWENLLPEIICLGYTIHIFGHPNDPQIKINNSYQNKLLDLRSLSFFDQIKMSLECELCINTDSGSGWVLGAYGHRQISLLSNTAPNHHKNYLAFAPINYYNNNISLFALDNCSNIKHEDIIDSLNL
jgi:ADP-heptose:LPS heptosyltransferase